MGWKKKPHDYKWDHKKIDRVALSEQLNAIFNWAYLHRNENKAFDSVMYSAMKVRRAVHQGSILVDLDYGYLFDVVESLYDYPDHATIMEALEAIYVIADIGTLAQDHVECRRKEDKWMKEKGFKNATS